MQKQKQKQQMFFAAFHFNLQSNVITQFLAIAKPDRDQKKETVDVGKALESLTDLLLSYGIFHQNDIDLHVEERIYISANAIEFKQLMINLLKMPLKFR